MSHHRLVSPQFNNFLCKKLNYHSELQLTDCFSDKDPGRSRFITVEIWLRHSLWCSYLLCCFSLKQRGKQHEYLIALLLKSFLSLSAGRAVLLRPRFQIKSIKKDIFFFFYFSVAFGSWANKNKNWKKSFGFQTEFTTPAVLRTNTVELTGPCFFLFCSPSSTLE